MKYKKVLVTGAAGFIGFFTVKRLLEEGCEVVGLDNINDYYDVTLKYARLYELGIGKLAAEKFKNIAFSDKYPSLKFMRMNLEDRQELPLLFKEEKFDAVINLAAQAGVRYSLENPESYIDSNIVGFLNILEACRHNKIKHLVYASSSSVYGENTKVPFEEIDRVDHPISLYAATKKSNELMAYTYSHLYNISTSGLRFFTVYGPWGRPDMAPILFASAIAKNDPIKIFNHGDMSRDFTYIDDIVEGILITLNKPISEYNGISHLNKKLVPYQLFNIGNGSPVPLMQFIQHLEKAMGKKAKKIMMGMQSGDVPQTWANTTRLQKLGYQSSIDIQKGIKKFIQWYSNYSLKMKS